MISRYIGTKNYCYTIEKITNILINHRESLEYKIHTVAPFLFKFINGL